jgi:HK97 family phage major capsid protein
MERAGSDWDASKLFADETLRANLAHAATSKSHAGPIQLGEIVSRDAFVADIAGTPNMRRGEYAGIVGQLRRRIRLLDLLPTGTTDGNSVPYTQESGTFTAAETAEGALKPESGLTFVDALAPVQTIPAWQKLRKQVLADIPAMTSIIDGRLRYSVERRLEDEILAGNGTDPNLLGILSTTGIGSVPFAAGSLPADLILTALTQVMLADAEPTGIVLHPSDWQTLISGKASDGHYYSGGPFSVTPQVLWGVPLVASRVIPQGTALVGDWEIGAQLFIREGVQVLISDSDQDDFLRNRVTLLAEMRAALAVWRPPAFSAVSLTA